MNIKSIINETNIDKEEIVSINIKKRNSKRSRAITDIVKAKGLEYWNNLSIRQKNAAIKDQRYKHKRQAKKGRKYMRDLNFELKGKIQKASW